VTPGERRRRRVPPELGLNLRPNEVSGLLMVENEALLEAQGWNFALWAVLDEGREPRTASPLSGTD
jgi:hypothetical protein